MRIVHSSIREAFVDSSFAFFVVGEFHLSSCHSRRELQLTCKFATPILPQQKTAAPAGKSLPLR
jgi:hypothetical protein